MRTGPLVMASLARWYPDFPFSIRLFDANSERLDLIDLLLRGFLDSWNSEVSAASMGELDAALEGATDVILTLHEDCARRLFGITNSEALAYFESAGEMEFYMGGDRNKPTPVSQLSENTRKLLESPKGEGSREEVLVHSANTVLEKLPESVRVLSLMRGVNLETGRKITEISWPEPIAEDQLAIVPHKILRWVRGDEGAFELGEIADKGPLLGWLKEGEGR